MRPQAASVHLARCGSTSAVAAVWARAGGALPAAFSADRQSAGRGQRGRRWQSPAGGCWFTLALAGGAGGSGLDATDAGLPQRAAAAVRLGVIDVCGALPIEVVEPNDLLLDGQKLGGLLCERLGLAGTATATLIGVGINANAAPEGLDPVTGEALRRPAASLAAALGHPVNPARVASACVERLLNAWP